MGVALRGETGPLAGSRIELGSGDHAIGVGASGLDLTGDDLATTLHAFLAVDDQGAAIRDAGGTPGVFVNGQRVTEAPLADGDLLQIGGSRFRVESAEEPAGLQCPACGAHLGPQPGPVCPRCGRDVGALLAGTVPPGPPADRYCAACGQKLPPAARFCGACGHESSPTAPATRARLPKWVLPAAAALLLLLLPLVLGTGVAIGLLASLRRAAQPLPGGAGLPVPSPPVAAPTVAPPPAAPAPPVPVSQAPWLQDGRVLLRYGGQPGQRFNFKSRSEVRGNMTVLGQSMPLVVTTEGGYRQEILDNQNGRLQMRLSIDPVTVRQDGLPFSGPTPTAPAPLTLTMEPNGRITSVEQPGGGEAAPVPGMPGGLTLDYRAITQQLAAAAFPTHPVGIGDTWRQTVNLPLGTGGSVDIQANCRLDGFEQLDGRPVARIVTQLTAPLTMKLTDPRDGQPVANVGTIEGTVTSHFDPAEGALVQSRSDLDMRMTMSLADGDTMKDLANVPGLGDLATKGGLSLEATGKVKMDVIREGHTDPPAR